MVESQRLSSLFPDISYRHACRQKTISETSSVFDQAYEVVPVTMLWQNVACLQKLQVKGDIVLTINAPLIFIKNDK